jgi:transposase
LERAKTCLKQARTVEELRQAQAVVLPLAYGLSLPQVAEALGVSVGWACRLRIRFIQEGGLNARARASTCGGRRRQNMSLEEETAFLAPFFESASTGGVLVVGAIRQALEETLGRAVALASVYNLLHRHGWRKLAPDKRHPETEGVAQRVFSK